MSQQTAENVYKNFSKLPTSERTKFFALLSGGVVHEENFTHDEVFSDLQDAEFTSKEAAQYLGISMATFRRYVKSQRIVASSEIGRSQLFSATVLKSFRRSLKGVD